MAEESSEKKKEVIRAVKFALFSASAGLIEAGTIFALEKLTPFPSWAPSREGRRRTDDSGVPVVGFRQGSAQGDCT